MSSRIKKSAYNLATNIGAQSLTILLSFISRTVFIITLDANYLGINGLFSNILSILSLADLGVGTAIIYSMYQPLANNNTKKLAALTQFFGRVYIIIAIVIACLGMALYPFLDFFVNLDVNIPNIKIYYLLFLAQSVASYLFIYKTSIVNADQKGYIINGNAMVINTISVIIQIVELLLFKSYIAYLIIQIATSILCNYFISRVSVKRYPYIEDKEQLDKSEKIEIWNNIKSMFMYKLGGVILNNTDNILISKIIGTVFVGIYSNYAMIITKVGNLISVIFISIQASVGNLNVEANSAKRFSIFKVLSFVSFWLYGFCSISFCVLLQDLMNLWLGNSYQLNNNVVYISVFNFYLQGVLYPIWCFRNTTGLFNYTKYTMIVASVINIVLSIVMGICWGLFGILLATAISRLITNIWFEPYKLFNMYFNKSSKNYYIFEIVRLSFLIIFIAFSQILFDSVCISNIYIRLMVKAIYCATVPNLIIYFRYRKTEEYLYIYDKTVAPLMNKIIH